MKTLWLGLVLGVLAAGCASGSASDGTSNTSVKLNQVPAAVQGAFYSEHPYAKAVSATKITNSDGSVSYELPYTNTDGSKGTVTYSDMGVLQNDTRD